MAMDDGGGAGGTGSRTGILGVRYLGNIATALAGLLTLFQDSSAVTVGVSTVAGLPTGVAQGTRRMVTNANATTFNSVVAAGGSNVVPVFWDGTNWRIG